MAKIFICYRREDASAHAGRLCDRLVSHFGDDNIFIDVDRIEPGADFHEAIEKAVSSCDVFLGIIGKRWAAGARGRRRLDDENDYVRLEIQAALGRNVRVIPCLVGGGKMPKSNSLPETLTKLARLQAVQISDEYFHSDIDRLVKALYKMIMPESAAPLGTYEDRQQEGDITSIIKKHFSEGKPIRPPGGNPITSNSTDFIDRDNRIMSGELLFGKYQINIEIARGGMGTIYQAMDIRLNREVAIKVLHAMFSNDASFVQRFDREAQSMARLNHPNIIGIYAVEKDKKSHYLVMEYFPGEDLKSHLRTEGHLPVQKSLEIGIKVAEGLAYAHDHGLIHRDVKPGNIMVDAEGRVKIADFGVAAALGESSITLSGTVIGTPKYMAPEQAKFGQVDARSDLYSLGIVLYEMLSGLNPYEGMDGVTVVGKLAYESDELKLSFPSDVPCIVQDIIYRLVKKKPEDRIQDAHQLIETLKTCLEELSSSANGSKR